MATLQPIPRGFRNIWADARGSAGNALSGLMAPDVPSQFAPGEKEKVVNALIDTVMGGGTPQEAYLNSLVNAAMPSYIAANYRSPEMIRALRRAMAEENRARNLPAERTKFYPASIYPQDMMQPYKKIPHNELVSLEETPIDQILRSSWFHGMRPEAREVISRNYNVPATPGRIEPYQLLAANERGFPGSTHATPSYTRFGEPYGVSITASPSVARDFSADEYIHRVQPLYGGPPTERIIPMWRPEGAKAMNEGYNAAFNQWLNQTDLPVTNTMAEYINHQLSPQGNASNYGSVSNILNDWANLALNHQTSAAEFNTLYSKALQDKGYRGILYSPQRYGEYEMLMLDPSYVRPLEYRKVGEYKSRNIDQTMSSENPWTRQRSQFGKMTPGAQRGYTAAKPEFQTGATRLTDVFQQQSWVDRINEENKRRILELIDPQYREQVGNQLMGAR